MKRFLASIILGVTAASCTAVAAQDLSTSPRPLLISAEKAEHPLKITAAEVDVATTGGRARTTLLLTVSNQNARDLEATVQFPLAPGQEVTGFALDIHGAMRDAVPVPKQQARQTFESIERRNVDPGLLEQVAGNQFRLRIYPVPAHGERRLRLVLDEDMQRDGKHWRMQLPLNLLSDVPQLQLQVRAGREAPKLDGLFGEVSMQRDAAAGGYRVVLPRGAFRAETGLTLRFQADARANSWAVAHAGEHYVLAEFPVSTRAKPRTIPDSVGLLWDASGSGAERDFADTFALLDQYFRAMGQGQVRLRLLRDVGQDAGVFDIRGGDWSVLRKALESVVYDGASNLADWQPTASIDEYLLVSDGLQNYTQQPMPMTAAGQRLYAVTAQVHQADAAWLQAVAQARGGRLVGWHGREGAQAAARLLLEQGGHVVTMTGAGVTDLVTGTRWIDDGMVRVAGRLLDPKGTIRLVLEDADGRREIHLPVAASDPQRPQVAAIWARWRVAGLSVDPLKNRVAMGQLGMQFSLVTAHTSLLVLEDPADYVRYQITPPGELAAEVAQLRKLQQVSDVAQQRGRIDEVVDAFADRVQWWQRKFPKDSLPVPAQQVSADAAAVARESPAMVGAPPPAPVAEMAPVASADAQQDSSSSDSTELQSISVTGAGAATAGAVIRLQPWQPDSPYARRLQSAPADRLYPLYLDERKAYAESTAFYLDVADILIKKGRRDEAFRVLSNLAEIDLENRHVLRVLGYRLMEAQAWPLAVDVFRQVLVMADEEPQSHRDLALALVANGQRQEAIERLYQVVVRSWDSRFHGVELVALNELNQIVATSPKALDTAFVDMRLLKNMPLDLRAVLSWDSDNSDIDLWVIDPNGERCFYGHQLTRQGGLLSNDFTGGYGPEEFVLRDAKPGTYRVEVQYYGDRQQVVTGATTLSLRFSTGWGRKDQRDQMVTLRLSEERESLLVGEFEVR